MKLAREPKESIDIHVEDEEENWADVWEQEESEKRPSPTVNSDHGWGESYDDSIPGDVNPLPKVSPRIISNDPWLDVSDLSKQLAKTQFGEMPISPKASSKATRSDITDLPRKLVKSQLDVIPTPVDCSDFAHPKKMALSKNRAERASMSSPIASEWSKQPPQNIKDNWNSEDDFFNEFLPTSGPKSKPQKPVLPTTPPAKLAPRPPAKSSAAPVSDDWGTDW